MLLIIQNQNLEIKHIMTNPSEIIVLEREKRRNIVERINLED